MEQPESLCLQMVQNVDFNMCGHLYYITVATDSPPALLVLGFAQPVRSEVRLNDFTSS